MFETAELGQKVSRQEYEEREPVLRQRLLEAQSSLRSADFPVLLLFAGVDGAGKGETSNLLQTWMDPRGIVTRSFGKPSEEEAERPRYWRFWRDLPPRGTTGIFLSAWYSQPLLRRVHGETSRKEHEDELERVLAFENMLAADGALILKFWMHLSRKAQKKRLKSLEKDPLTSWRVTKTDWAHWKKYDAFIEAAEDTIRRTSTGCAPWKIVEGEDRRFRSLEVGSILLERIEQHLATRGSATDSAPVAKEDAPLQAGNVTVLSSLDLDATLDKKNYSRKREKYQGELNRLYRSAKKKGVSVLLVFEGWDAAGKGGAIRRITPALDARDYQVISIGAPTDEERQRHYLWRFWRHLSRAGRVTIFDRSWYGRVLVERVEGFATSAEWAQAYAEIRDFEYQLIDHGIVLVKFWIHISREEQEQRFRAREQTAHKRWKLTEEDWRNRQRWDDYEVAVNEMIERTSTRDAPWTLIEGNDKRYARIKVLRTVRDALRKALDGDDRGTDEG